MAWSIDADTIKVIDTDRLADSVVANKAVGDFLQIGERDSRFFIVAPKGLGKTLLLKVKSQLYRDRQSGYRFFPENELCEKLTRAGVSFSREDIEKFATRAVWIQLWEICLLSLILRGVGATLPKDLSAVLGDAGALADILGALLRERSQIDYLHRYVNTDLRPALRNLSTHGKVTQVAVFIDNIDEALEDLTGYPLFRRTAGNPPDPHSRHATAWSNAQLGIMRAAKDICASNRHVKIFASIRSEAFSLNQDATALQTEAYSTHLRYTKQEVRKIFTQNINSTPKEQLVQLASPDPLERFIGFSALPHRFARDESGSPKVEDAFDFIFRHTFGRPREIVQMGSELADLPSLERTADAVIDKVNDVADRLFSQYKNEVVPYFRDDLLDLFCREAASNVFSLEDARRIYEKANTELSYDHIVSYFWRLGLVGVVERDRRRNHEGKYIQKFLPVAEYTLHQRNIPEYPDYFLVHPALDREFGRQHGASFWEKRNIIGYDYDFNPPTHRETALHVHLGLDRDSLSLTLPSLCATKTILVIQKPTAEWHKIEAATELEIVINDVAKLRLNVLRDYGDNLKIEQILRKWEDGGHVLLITERMEPLISALGKAPVLTVADSALDPQLIPKIELSINRQSRPENIFITQRLPSKSLVNRWRQALCSVPDTSVTLEPMLVDRFTHSMDLRSAPDNQSMRISIRAENYGMLVLPQVSGSPAEPDARIRRTQSSGELDFYCQRQKLLLEGIYRLCKIIRFDSGIDLAGLEDPVHDLFGRIQTERLLRRIPLSRVTKFLPNHTESEARENLRKYSASVRARVESIPKKYQRPLMPRLASSSRGLGVFPKTKDFYDLTRRALPTFPTDVVLKLRELLSVPDRTDLASAFISYSFKDDSFAKRLSRALRVRGAKHFLFQQDDPFKPLERIMSEEVEKADVLIFIASRHSVQSRGCQFELTKFREKRARNWTCPLVTLRLDDFILDLRKDNIPKNDRRQFWENIKMLRGENLKDFSAYANVRAGRDEFNREIDQMVAEVLSP